ncbi:MAG: flagellar motor protein MotB [Lachnospiraceae bacterium]|nr:flagellar motor protein MotB [Lachnospiraceae bacterium]
MAKRRQEDPPAGSPAWMSTFSDLMNLLLCFFVLLFSMSTVDEAKYNALVAAMNNTFSIFESGATAIGEGILISNGVSQLHELDKYINSTGKLDDGETNEDKLDKFQGTLEEQLEEYEEQLEEIKLQENENLAELIEEAVAESNMSDQIEVSFTAQYVQLTMKGALLFDSGSAQIKAESERVLDKVSVILERYAESEIEIAGHTDNVPISSSRYADNEELSSDRALSVFYYLMEHCKVDPVRFKHSGMGERLPVADNATEEGRTRNRRVEIRILSPA